MQLWKPLLVYTTSEFGAVSGAGESNEKLIPDKVFSVNGHLASSLLERDGRD